MPNYKFEMFSISNILILINILVFLGTSSFHGASLYFGLNDHFLKSNLWYQPLTTMFMHANWIHLFMNMFVLFQFGNILEQLIGKSKFLALFLIGGISTSILTFLYIHNIAIEHNVIGASGAICMILGFFSMIDKQHQTGILVWILLISFGPLLLGQNVAWYGHIAGYITGISIYFISRKFSANMH